MENNRLAPPGNREKKTRKKESGENREEQGAGERDALVALGHLKRLGGDRRVGLASRRDRELGR
ncbi:hypothetical protein GCM10009087_54400 [Sphingomonas oligophenolica]